MPKSKLTTAEKRAYRRLACAAREVERLEKLRRLPKPKRAAIEQHFADGSLMFGDNPRLASPAKQMEGRSDV